MFAKVADGITSGTVANITANGIAGPANSVTLGFTDSYAGFVTITGGTFGAAAGTGITANTAKDQLTLTTSASGATATVMTPAVGTITVNYYKNLSAGVFSSTVTETVVITVKATGSAGVYSATNSKVYIGAGETYTAITADPTTTITKVKTYGATDSATATILVTYKDGVSTGSPITYLAKDTITATITSGPGTIYVPVAAVAAYGQQFDSTSTKWPLAAGGDAAGGDATSSTSVGTYTASALPDNNGQVAFMLFANGQAGTSTITIKNGAGTILSTKTVLFTGTDVSSITATVKKANVNALTSTAVGAVVTLALKDSAGNAVTGLTWAPTVEYDVSTLGAYRASSAGVDTDTSDTSGVVTYGWTPVATKYGPVKVTFTDPTTKATASVTLNMVSPVAKTVTITAPANVALGAPFDFTVTAKDANGYSIPDGLLASDIVASVSSYAGVTTPALTGKFANGVATIAATGPTVNSALGTSIFTMVGTAGTASTYLDKTLTATTATVTYTIDGTEGDSTAALALDAANAATDAANNAYDEAQNATQAASDALAAVTALAAQVKTLIASVKALTAAVAKLKK